MNIKKIVLKIDGMTCSACSNGLEKYLKRQEEIVDVNVNLILAIATITYKDIKIKNIVNKTIGRKNGISEQLKICPNYRDRHQHNQRSLKNSKNCQSSYFKKDICDSVYHGIFLYLYILNMIE